MVRSADIHVFVTRDGRVRARIEMGSKARILTVPRQTAVECMADVTAWLEGYLDTSWPEEPSTVEEGA